VVDRRAAKVSGGHDDELGPGSLFSTGLVAGGALAGVLVAILTVNEGINKAIERLDLGKILTATLGGGGYQLLGCAFFAVMGIVLYRVARRPQI
jgi:hypothetical protein